MRVIAGLVLLAAACLAWPQPVRAQVSDDALSQALQARDRAIQQLLDRVEALERELRAIREAQGAPTPGAPGVPPSPAVAAPPPAPLPAPPARAAEAPPLPGPPVPPPPSPAGPPVPVPPPAPPARTAEAPPSPPAQEEEERDVTRVPVAAVERGGSLLKPGSFQIDTNLGYSYSESTRLIITGFSVLPLIVLGTLESERVKNTALSPALTLRYGFMKDFQGQISIPVTYQTQSRIRLSNDIAALVSEEASQLGIGDIDFGITYQPLYEKGWIPDLTVGLRARLPTGRSQFDIFEDMVRQGPFTTIEDFVRRLSGEGLPIGSGFYGTTISLGASKAYDPIVLFGSLGYTYYLERTVKIVQIAGLPAEGGIVLHPVTAEVDIKPGDSVFFSLGAAVALTGQVSVNFSFSDRITFKSKQDGQQIGASDTNVGQFNAGITLGLARGFVVEFGGSIGLTPEAPSFGLSLGVVKSFTSIQELWDLLWPFGAGK